MDGGGTFEGMMVTTNVQRKVGGRIGVFSYLHRDETGCVGDDGAYSIYCFGNPDFASAVLKKARDMDIPSPNANDEPLVLHLEDCTFHLRHGGGGFDILTVVNPDVDKRNHAVGKLGEMLG